MVLFTPNSIDSATVTFGTLWAGGVICPVNNLLKVGELTRLLKSSHAKALTTHIDCLETAQQAASIAGLSPNHIFLLGDADLRSPFRHFSSIQTDDIAQKKVEVNPEEDLSFLVFSSGTTGLPKGVMLTHKNMVANTLQSVYQDNDHWNWKHDQLLGYLPMYHIYGMFNVSIHVSIYTANNLFRYRCTHTNTDLPGSYCSHYAALRS